MQLNFLLNNLLTMEVLKKDIISSINKFMIDEKINNSIKIEYIIKTPKNISNTQI